MKIKGLIGTKKDIFEYVFRPFSEYYTITPNEDGVSYDIYFKSKLKNLIMRYDREIEEVRITIEVYTVILDVSEFLKIEII